MIWGAAGEHLSSGCLVELPGASCWGAGPVRTGVFCGGTCRERKRAHNGFWSGTEVRVARVVPRFAQGGLVASRSRDQMPDGSFGAYLPDGGALAGQGIERAPLYALTGVGGKATLTFRAQAGPAHLNNWIAS